MRTSFCIIMAAVMSLCLFGVGSDMNEPMLQDTMPSDTVDRTAYETSTTISDTGTPDATEVYTDTATDQTTYTDTASDISTDNIVKEVTNDNVSTDALHGSDADTDAPETESPLPSQTEDSPSQSIAEILTETPPYIQSRSADSVAGGLTDDSIVTVYDHNSGDYMSITLREYVIGVVAAEMPISFGEEALRAQAIAARTYAIYKLCRGGVSDHPYAAICNAPSHCCAFVPESAAVDKWGNSADSVLAASRQAVTDTENTVIIYEESCICAAWHSSSTGYTKNASDVWGGHVAYLCSVPTEEDRHSAGHGVGMSQYGAKEMADRGALAAEILTHYYTDCTVVRIG